MLSKGIQQTMQASQTASRNGDTKEGGGKSAVIRPKESRVGGPFISARSLKQGERDRRASAHACSRSPSVGQCFLSFTRIYWGSGSLRKNLRAICLLPPFCRSSLTPLSLVRLRSLPPLSYSKRMRFQYHLDPQSRHCRRKQCPRDQAVPSHSLSAKWFDGPNETTFSINQV